MKASETETAKWGLDIWIDNIKTKLKHRPDLTKVHLDTLSKIGETTHSLDNSVNELESTIKGILDKQYDEYVKTFNSFMDKIRKEITEKIEEMERRERENKKLNDIRKIKCERDFFKLEAIRWNSLCKEMSSKIEEMAFQMKLNTNEWNTMTTKWKESENVNKQLLVELESNIQNCREIEKENLELKDEWIKVNENNQISNNNNYDEVDPSKSNNNINEIENIKNERLWYIIERLKMDLKKERLRNHKTWSEFNKMILDKNKLESIFSDCVEEVRKDIFNRKWKESVLESKRYSAKGGNSMSQNTKLNIPHISEIKYEKFLSNDKRKVIELFVVNEDITTIIKEVVFNKPKNEIEQILGNNAEGQINIWNENKILMSTLSGGKGINDNWMSIGNSKTRYDSMGNTKSSFIKSKFNFANSFGKKTQLNFGMGGMLKNNNLVI